MLDQHSRWGLAIGRARPFTRDAAFRRNVTLHVVGVATLLVSIVFTTVLTTVGQTAASFRATVDGQTWALGGMSLGLASALLSAGSLADVLGRRRVFVWSGLALAASSALAASAWSMTVFVLARILEGAAAAGVVAAGLGLIGHAFPAGAARTRATGVWGAMVAGGIAVGPILGAALAVVSNWRAAYGLEAAAAIAVAGAGMMLSESGDPCDPTEAETDPTAAGAAAARAAAAGAAAGAGRDRPARWRRLDLAGALTVLIAMGSLTAALTSGRTGWTSTTTVLLLVTGVAGLGVFVRMEKRHPAPLLDLALLRRPLFLVSISGAAITGLATVALMSYVPTVLERGWGHSPLTAGVILAIWSATSMLVSMQAGRLPERFHSRGRLVAGLLAGGAGSAALAWLGTASPWWELVPGLVIAGVGSGLGNAALARLAVESVPAGNAALGSGATNTARYLGSALGIALTVAIVAGGGSGPAGLIDGWNRAALIAALLNLAGAALAASAGSTTAIRRSAIPAEADRHRQV